MNLQAMKREIQKYTSYQTSDIHNCVRISSRTVDNYFHVGYSWKNLEESHFLNYTGYLGKNKELQEFTSETYVTLPHRPGTISNINRRYTSQIQDRPVASNTKSLFLTATFNTAVGHRNARETEWKVLVLM